MIRLDKPINVEITGENTSGQAILTVGNNPLPDNDSAVTTILFGVDVSVSETCTVQIKSNTTVLYEKDFEGASNDNVNGIIRKGAATHDMKLYVTGCGVSSVVKVIADVGFEYNGGAIATGGSRS